MLRALSDIAKAFTSQFTRIGKDLANTIFNSNVDPLTYVEQTSRSFSFREIAINDVLKLLRKIDTNKATGLDKIPSKLLKIAGDTLAPSLTAIFNRPLSTGIFSHDKKKARVSPIFKNGSKLNALSRLSLLLPKYKLNTNYLLSKCQSGFRSLHITLTALLEARNK